MIQTWILVEDAHPLIARRDGRDTTVCGTCPLASGQGCYVNLAWAPAALYRQLPGMPEFDGHLPRNRPVRLGAYGDPAAVPIDVWRDLLTDCWTAFTHLWREPRVQPFREFCMASTEDTASTREAQEKGWRTFRLRPCGTPLLPGELECVERTHGIPCEACLLCRGKRLPGARHVSIETHGASEARASGVSRWLELLNAGKLSSA